MDSKENITFLTGIIENIVYYNPDNGYSVFDLVGEFNYTCTGSFLGIKEGMNVKVYGNIVYHPKYGEQFKVNQYEEVEPQDSFSIQKYLGSGIIKGVGPKLAKSIVDKFGDDTFNIIEQQPERLAEIRGISERKALDIYAQLEDTRIKRDAMIFLQKYNVSANLAIKIYDRYKENLYKVLKENPYKLTEDIEGVGFKKADDIAMSMGFEADSELRINNCIIDILRNIIRNGHMFLPYEKLLKLTNEYLGFEIPNFDDYLSNLMMQNHISINDVETLGTKTKAIYYSRLYYNELECASLLCKLNTKSIVDIDQVNNRIIEFEKENDIELDELQRLGVIEATQNNIFVLTGGPGTGKTTTIQAIIDIFENADMDITLCAPTGRAAHRMTEATSHSAQTIHRMLEVQVGSDDESKERLYFAKNEDNPIETDVIIVDEASMVDEILMNNLLRAVLPGTHLILIGDTSQLPSVGPGSVLADIIDSNCFKCLELTQIFRQAESSDIVVNAHRINDGEDIVINKGSQDFFFMTRNSASSIVMEIKELVKTKLPKFLNASPFDIQVLCPSRKGPLGIDTLNPILQEYINPPSSNKKEYKTSHAIFREGDKVMQNKNDYQLTWQIYGTNDIVVDEGTGVFNGDIGKIKSIDTLYEEVVVVFDDNKEVSYPFEGLDELELAYALTIHKSQGSEYEGIIIPVLNVLPLLKYRNILYTGITRAKSLCLLMGSRDIVKEMIRNENEQKRYTALKFYIEQFSKTDKDDFGFSIS